MLIRLPALDDDAVAEAVYRIGRAAYAVGAEIIGFDGIPALRESLTQIRAQEPSWVGAVFEGGEIAGFLAWAEEADGGVCVARLCVDPGWFRRGVASLLLSHALGGLLPGRPAKVTTGAANAPAAGLYERLGFVRGEDFSPAPGLRIASFTRTTC
ncbi:GNAT family N-acetyltransferase [Streptomyces sp. NPDC059533]|uniref:GNAT family N-acetyltransferase n=1 Tax=unclassified Streptomyces TaxID=2593676 RepID=UPI0036AAA19D